ncbi:MAG: C25 family cysteine peptidase [Dysgonomonas sp.]
MFRKYIVLFIYLFSAYSLFSQIKYTENFEKNKLIVNVTSSENGVDYDNIVYDGLENFGNVGYPELPAKYIKLSVPADADSFEIIEKNIEKEDISISNLIYPVQHPTPTSIDYPQTIEFTEPCAEVYESMDTYPKRTVYVIGRGFLDGDKQIITVAIYPVRYQPANGKIEFVKNISFEVNYSTSVIQSSDNSLTILSRKNISDKNISSSIKQIVVNKEDVDKNIENTSSVQYVYSNQSISLPFYEYCVITTREVAPAFERLTSWKKMKGIDAGIICLEDILSDPNITGDRISRLYDDAGKIRDYLTYAYLAGTKYILFGGNDQLLPIRYGTGYENSWANGVYKIPADLYFSDLNSNWNKDRDQYLGEPSDSLDCYPELYVGRILCNNKEEADFYITKLLKYEQNPGNGNFSYLKKAFYTQSDQLQKYSQAQSVSNKFINIFDYETIYEEAPGYYDTNPTFPSGQDVINEINNRYGFIGWFNHASPEGNSVSAAYFNSAPRHIVKSYNDFNPTWAVTEVNNGLDNITNEDYPAISYSIGCNHTPFDKWNPNNLVPHVTHNFGESFTSRGLYGGPAFLGNTRDGLTDTYYKLMQEFAQCISNGYHRIGVAEALSKAYIISSDKHWLSLVNNLVGCPEFEMWTEIPARFTPNDSVSEYTSNVLVDIREEDATVTINGIFSGNDYLEQKIGSCSFTNVPQNYTIMLHKNDSSAVYIPYIFPIYAQNENVIGSHYIHGSDIYLGKQVLPSKTTGDLIIESGSKVIIEASGVVILDRGFEVEAGGEFYIRK